MAQSKTFRRRQHDIAAFADALKRFLEVCDPHASFAGNPTWALAPATKPKPLGAQPKWIASRAAAVAFGREFFIEWKPRGTFQTQPVSPATGWSTILDRDPNFTVDVIFAVCNQAVGVLDAWASESEEHEQSLGGKLERVTGLGLPRTASGHVRAAFVASVIGIPSALLVAYLAYRLGRA